MEHGTFWNAIYAKLHVRRIFSRLQTKNKNVNFSSIYANICNRLCAQQIENVLSINYIFINTVDSLKTMSLVIKRSKQGCFFLIPAMSHTTLHSTFYIIFLIG